ncbi:MAG: cyclic nucleotide-binding/CBS domain-containing protein [Polaromonas sp.]|nr:cyclic nucleotide-binding/CBS domain-containing protein [Polaromonas sp.]
MQVEQIEILDFLRGLPVLQGLPEDALQLAAAAVDVRYHPAGQRILEFGDTAQNWFILRSGAVEVYRRDGSLYNRLAAGGHFGEFGLLRHRRVRFPTTALEDCLVYLIPEPVFTELFEAYPDFADQVEIEDNSRLRSAVQGRDGSGEILTEPVETLVSRAAVMVDGSASARDAATRMTDEGVSCLLVTAPNADADAPAQLVGIVTDRDLRTRLIATGLPFDTPVQQLMTPTLVSVQHEQRVSDAWQQMLRHNVHHLPVLKQEQPIGVITLSDLIRNESNQSVYLVGRILRCKNVDELVALATDVRACFLQLAQAETHAKLVGVTTSALGRSFQQRLLELAEAELGPPPVRYCFLALGSVARQEQLLVSDQDNALVLANDFDPVRHDAYFKALATRVSDGLDLCGYPYCTGGVMATNDAWRQPLKVWEQIFTRWIEQPTAQDLLNSSIFFDLDCVAGQPALIERLRHQIARQAKASPRFLASMARNALLRTPPLGFFKGFVMESDGRQANTINLKRRGTAPLVDLIRVHALAVGSSARNSFTRIKDVTDAGILPPGRGRDLGAALAFISSVRIRHMADDLTSGREPDNSIEPDNLSDFDRKNLREAFLVLDGAQQFLKFRYQPGRTN